MKTKISDNTRQYRTIRQRHPGTLFRASMLTVVFLCAAAVICGTATGAVDVNVNQAGWWNATDDTTFHAINPGQIQAAIDNAIAGDTIYVWNGSYSENVDIATAHLTLAGEGVGVVVTAVDPRDHVFEVTADHVNISGFTVTGATMNSQYAGIHLNSGVDHCNIHENNCSNNYYGIGLEPSSSSNTLTGNNCSNNYNGIWLRSSSNNILTGNTASNNNYGICMYSSSNNMLADNTASNNNDYGIWLRSSSSSNTLTGNNCSNNYNGIWLYCSSNNTLLNNTMSGNTRNFGVQGNNLNYYIQDIDMNNIVDGKPIYYWIGQHDMQIPGDAGFVGIVSSTNITVRYLTLTNNSQGVLFVHTDNSRIENANISNNGYGILVYSSSNNTITNNIITSNKNRGIHLSSSSDNLIYNNYFNNYFYSKDFLYTTTNAYDDGINQWNTTKTNRKNIIGGHLLGGNYWSNYTGADNSGDDPNDIPTPYTSFGGIQNGGDYLPLIEANGTPPTALFTFSHSHSVVSFNASGSYDPDGGNITEYWWKIDGTVYTIPDFNHAFTTSGLKCCCLVVTDGGGGTNESIKWVNVNVTIGDLNHDDSLTPADATIALQIAVGSRPFDDAADVSGDGKVTSLDALMIMQAAAGAISL